MKRVVSVLALSVLLDGCVNTVAGIIGESVCVLLGDKVVSSKVEPNVLVAMDGTLCTVSPERWEKAEVGHRYFCHWTSAE
jgi:predicted small secreted protein